jgi:DNA-binding PadR family transcriptional regulator
LLDLAILGLLADNDLHGYELKKRLGELVGTRAGVSFGSLYPALGRLERAGLVKAVESRTSAAPPVPMTGSLGAEVAAFRARRGGTARGQRNRKVYGITSAGEERLDVLLAAPAVDDRTFNLQVAFCERLEPTARLALFSSRRAELAARLANAHTAAGKSASSTTAAEGWRNRYRRALRDRDTASLRAELAWLDDLIAAESSGDSPDEPGIDAEPVHTTNTTTVHGGSTR